MDQIKAFTLLLLFAELSAAGTANPLAGEAEKLAAFMKGHVQEFSPIDHELDPIYHETPRDLFILTDELEVGGEVSALTFTGFSKFENLDVEVVELTLPPEKLFGSFLLNLDIPAVITGHQKLNGVYRENGTEILFGGEGSWTISAKALHRDEHFLREEPEGFIHQYQFSISLKLENPTLDMPGLFGEDVPAAVIDVVLDQITNEIWNIYERELEEEMWLAIYNVLKEKFEETPFAEIFSSEIPVQKHAAPPTPTWPPMDAFLSKVMNEFSDSTAAAGLDPMNYLDIDVNITWPDYMHLQGSITNLTLYGVKDIRHQSSYSPEGYFEFTINSEFPNAFLEGRQNIGGPFELDTGENLTLGGIESDFVFKSRPATGYLTYTYEVESSTGVITLNHAMRLGFDLKNGQNDWDIDFHGLLNSVPEGPQKENAIDWIGDGIESAVESNIIYKIDYRVQKFLANAFSKTTYYEIANGSALKSR